MSGISIKNWGVGLDFLMMGLLMVFVGASLSSPILGVGDYGPIALLIGATDPHWTLPGVLASALLGLVSVEAIYRAWYEVGRAGGVYFRTESGIIIKEAQPFSQARGYGTWQGFYYAFFWVMVLALIYNAVLAAYTIAPGNFPMNVFSAWSYSFIHLKMYETGIYQTGNWAFALGLLTWATRAYPKSFLVGLGWLDIPHWYSETEDEQEIAEALSELCAKQSAVLALSMAFY